MTLSGECKILITNLAQARSCLVLMDYQHSLSVWHFPAADQLLCPCAGVMFWACDCALTFSLIPRLTAQKASKEQPNHTPLFLLGIKCEMKLSLKGNVWYFSAVVIVWLHSDSQNEYVWFALNLFELPFFLFNIVKLHSQLHFLLWWRLCGGFFFKLKFFLKVLQKKQVNFFCYYCDYVIISLWLKH